MAADEYRLRVGIDFDQAKRDISDFAQESQRVTAQLAQNINAAIRTQLAGASTGTISQQAAGGALSEIRREILTIQKELERAFRNAGQAFKPGPLTEDIDKLTRGDRKGFNRYQVGGVPIFDKNAAIPVGRNLQLPAIRSGFNAREEQFTNEQRALQSGAIGLIKYANEQRKELAEALERQATYERARLADMLNDPKLGSQIAAARADQLDAARQIAAIQKRELAQAQLRGGFAAQASNVGTARIFNAPSDRLRSDSTGLASLNQNIERTFRAQQPTAQQLAAINASIGSAFKTSTAQATRSVAAAQQNTTRFQQLYNYLHSRGGAGGGVGGAPPTLGKFLGQRALSTAAFGLSGGLLYGGLSFAKELITEANELQVQLGITESVFKSFGGTINGEDFSEYKKNVIDISRETGVAANEVASITRQLAGAFASIGEDGTVTPNFQAGEAIATKALQLSKITGLPQQEISDSFSASVLAFTRNGEDPTEVANDLADALVGLEARFGTSTSETLAFTASLASLAAESGFTLEQLTGFGAVVEQALGSDVAAAENIGRIFASLASNIAPIAELLQRGGINTDSLVENLGAGDLPNALKDIIGAYDEIDGNDALKRQLGVLIGGERQARTFFAVLARGDQVLNALNTGSGDFEGQFDDRWDRYADTVQASFERMQRAIEEFGLALFDAGLVDALLFLAQAGEDVASVGKLLLDVFGDLNDLFGGLPAKILLTAAALKVAGIAGGFLGVGKGGPGLVSRTAGFLNPSIAGGASPYRVTGFQQGTGLPIGGLRSGLVNKGGPGFLKRSPLGAAAASGSVGAGFAGVAATIAPLVAAVAITSLFQEVESTAGQIDSAREQLRERVRTEIARGVSPKTLRERLESRRGPAEDFGSDVTNAVTSGFGLLGDSKNDFAVSEDEIERAEADGKLARLRAIKSAGVNEIRFGGRRDEALDVDELISTFSANSTNGRVIEMVDAAIKQAEEDNPKVKSAFDQISAQAEKDRDEAERTTATLEKAASGELSASVAELELLFSTGEATLDELVTAYEANAKLQRDTYEALRETDPETALASLKASIESTNAAAQVTLKDQQERYARAEAVVGSITGDDPTALLAVKQRQFAETKDPKDRLQIALQIRELQQEILNEQADLLDSAGAQIALLKSGIDADPSAAAILVAQVSEIDPIWVAFLNTTFGSVKEASAFIEAAAKLAIENGITMAEALASVVNQGIARAKASMPAFLNGLNKVYNSQEVSNIQDYVNGLLGKTQGQVDAVEGANLPDVGGGTVTDPAAAAALEKSEREAAAAKAKAAAEAARAEAEALANARLDAAAALVDGNTAALAQIARQRAQIALQFASTESERVAAYAQLIAADNAIREAFRAQVAAERDLAVAKVNDDPVAAATAAVRNAQDALTAARGRQAQAEAQAALIRAQRGQRDAILGLADAQTDILIASATAAGHTVEAARLGLQKIQRQLARTDLNSTERSSLEAERISAEAGVRDAQLSEERATIDYQLAIGDITKQQAIGALQSLLTIPKLTEEQIREINLAIKDLKSQLGADFQFNLPTQLGLPTVYEVRRLGQSGGGGGGYSDNRTIQVNVSVATDADPDQIAAAVVTAVGQPGLQGTISKRY